MVHIQIGVDSSDIFESATVNKQSQPSQEQAAVMETETVVSPNMSVPTQNNESRSYTTTTKTIGGSQQTVLTRAAHL